MPIAESRGKTNTGLDDSRKASKPLKKHETGPCPHTAVVFLIDPDIASRTSFLAARGSEEHRPWLRSCCSLQEIAYIDWPSSRCRSNHGPGRLAVASRSNNCRWLNTSSGPRLGASLPLTTISNFVFFIISLSALRLSKTVELHYGKPFLHMQIQYPSHDHALALPLAQCSNTKVRHKIDTQQSLLDSLKTITSPQPQISTKRGNTSCNHLCTDNYKHHFNNQLHNNNITFSPTTLTPPKPPPRTPPKNPKIHSTRRPNPKAAPLRINPNITFNLGSPRLLLQRPRIRLGR